MSKRTRKLTIDPDDYDPWVSHDGERIKLTLTEWGTWDPGTKKDSADKVVVLELSPCHLGWFAGLAKTVIHRHHSRIQDLKVAAQGVVEA